MTPRMSSFVDRMSRMRAATASSSPAPAQADRLLDLAFRDNPGGLRGRYYLPEALPDAAPLVVVLHGCTQDAAGYDRGSGWSHFADAHGVALLFPEQQRANNANLCFNWFTANDTQRGMGEAASIRSMIAALAKLHAIDSKRIFVTGLSAGGAMASVMLATYPEIFAAGAIIAGIPYGCASGVAEAFDCMGGRALVGADALGQAIRTASPHKGPWPRVSVWQGTADPTVVPSNADAIITQWRTVHGLPAEPSRVETVDTYPHRVWSDAHGRDIIEHYAITGMAHGTPLRPGTAEGEFGVAGAHMLDAQISSTARIGAFFGLAPPPPQTTGELRPPRAETGDAAVSSFVQRTIDDAMRSAGLRG